MKTVSWNVRVVGRKDFRTQTKLLLHSHNPDIIILMESRIDIKKAYSIIGSFNFPNFETIPLEGFVGGIWLMWKDSSLLSVNIMAVDKRFFQCLIKDNIKHMF